MAQVRHLLLAFPCSQAGVGCAGDGSSIPCANQFGIHGARLMVIVLLSTAWGQAGASRDGVAIPLWVCQSAALDAQRPEQPWVRPCWYGGPAGPAGCLPLNSRGAYLLGRRSRCGRIGTRCLPCGPWGVDPMAVPARCAVYVVREVFTSRIGWGRCCLNYAWDVYLMAPCAVRSV